MRHAPLHVALVACLCVVGGVQAAAQPSPAPSRLEGWVAVAIARAAAAGRLDASQQLEVASAPEADGRARQTLALEPESGLALDAGLNVFPSQHVGVQAFVSRAREDVGGANTPYLLELRYVSRPPPDSQPVPVESLVSSPWPATYGRLTWWTLGAGPALAWRGARTEFVAAGGLAWVRARGEAEPLGYTSFRLGGHSTLFQEDLGLRAAIGPASGFAGFLSAAVDVRAGRRAALTGGVRLLLGGGVEVPATIDQVVDTSGGVSAPSLAQVNRLVTVEPGPLRPPRACVFVGIKLG